MVSENIGTTKVLLNLTKTLMSILLSIIFYILVIFAISKACTATYGFMYQIFGEVSVQNAPGTDLEFTISEGESTMSVASRLEYGKIVVNKYSFYIRAKLDTAGAGILPGTYELNTSMTYGEILSVITNAEAAAGGSEEQKE